MDDDAFEVSVTMYGRRLYIITGCYNIASPRVRISFTGRLHLVIRRV